MTRGRVRSGPEIQQVLACKAAGLTDRETSLISGVPIDTIRQWRRLGTPRPRQASQCWVCGGASFDGEPPDLAEYCYLLGLYLGDGIVREWGGGWTLRVTLDTVYPGIVGECAGAMRILRGREPKIRPDPRCECLYVESSWVHWACFLPQHGPGRKHDREITLTDWQQALVAQAPGSLLRGLIHSDGWRGMNKVRSKGRDYAYPRYQFSNRSDDIRRIFTDTCELMGIEWRQWTRYHVSVAKHASVALLDQYVGPKH